MVISFLLSALPKKEEKLSYAERVLSLLKELEPSDSYDLPRLRLRVEFVANII